MGGWAETMGVGESRGRVIQWDRGLAHIQELEPNPLLVGTERSLRRPNVDSDDPTHVGMGKVELECDPLGTCVDPPAVETQQPPPMGKVDSARDSLSTHVDPLPLQTRCSPAMLII